MSDDNSVKNNEDNSINNGEINQTNPPKSKGPAHVSGKGGPMGMGLPTEKPADFKGSMKKLAKYLAPYKFLLLLVVALAVISASFAIIGPRILGDATTEIVNGLMGTITGSGEGIDFTVIGRMMLWLIGLYVTSSIFGYLQGHLMAHVSTKVAYDLRNSIMKKINALPVEYFHKTSHGDVLSRITNDVDVLNQNLNQGISQFITSVVSIIGALIMMFSISWQMTLIALAVLPISMMLVMVTVKLSQKHFTGQQKYIGTINGHVEEMYGGHAVVKAFNQEEESVSKFNEENDKLYESAWKSEFFSGLIMPIMGFISNLGYVLVCIAGAVLTSRGNITIGNIQSFIIYVRNFNQPIMQLASIAGTIQQTAAASERVFQFLNEPEENLNPIPDIEVNGDVAIADITNRPNVPNVPKHEGDITFSHVNFGYEPDKTVIHDFSAEVKAGQKIAIVGPTGAGKTTIVKLLMRFYEINSGNIIIDGKDIRSYSKEELRSQFGMVLQDAWLYNGTIMDNIRYGKLDATDEEVIEAAKAAQADHFIRTLPDSYKLVLNEESGNISQGQKQLLTIARAILADSKMLILDEATSSVDTRTEILIQKAMDNLMHGRTSFIIAHRLSTIRNADMILCMNHGDIVEQGTHNELMEKNGFYANLYNSQFESISEIEEDEVS